MFMGEYEHTIDGKGRLILPAKFREELGAKFIVTKGLENCLFIYAESEWQALEARLRRLPLGKAEARAFVRFFFAGAAEVEFDKQGRILLPANLRTYATLEKEVTVIGVSSRVEIWSSAAWQQYNDTVAPSVVQMADDLADLGI